MTQDVRLQAALARSSALGLPSADGWQAAGDAGSRDARKIVSAGLKRFLRRETDTRMLFSYELGALTVIADAMRVMLGGTPDAAFVTERYAVGYIRAALRGVPPGPDGMCYPIEADGSPMRDAGPMPSAPNA